MAIAFLLLGGNLGDRERMLETAVGHLVKSSGALLASSSIYETQPWGNHEQPLFLNQVICLETRLSPSELLDEIQAIELRMGRKRNGHRYQPRPMDIDILFYDDIILQSERLTIPHPLLHKRAFTLIPLMEIAPGLIHPVLNRSIDELCRSNHDPLTVRKYRLKHNTEA
ncbi:MAG: 2-amino-4-hydroxy-6-hydroxymethyldihydropteridine diphosphokinase [Bacteroidales bacterium]|nr:2-amino-4-hydroxy-6-hydroxymethyldihydropteridine diphosphokinase [Lentimicrobiaceae bacterium]MDD5694200.1 2-amino-4-hydroxy-6-hydroxymethyldihydropteridine diphosphokinase [Bacteroidales bacterium]